MGGMYLLSNIGIGHPGVGEQSNKSHEALHLILGERVIMAIVEEVRGEQAKVNTGKVQPRYVPMNIRKEKWLPE